MPTIGGGGGISSFPTIGNTPVYGATQGGQEGLGYNPQIPLPTDTQASAIQGDIGQLGNIYNLANNINTEQNFQALQDLSTNLPGYKQMMGQETANTQALLGGQIPTDVLNKIYQQGAERGVTTGMPGSPNANAATLAALGLTSLGLQQQGMQNLSTEIGQTPTVAPIDISQFLVTPAQQQAAAAQNALLAAAPNPTAVQRANLGAANAGIAAGQNAGGGGGLNPNTLASLLGSGQYGAGLPGTASAPGTPSTPATQAYKNWNDWWTQNRGMTPTAPAGPTGTGAQLPGEMPAGTSYDPSQGYGTDYSTGQSYMGDTGVPISDPSQVYDPTYADPGGGWQPWNYSPPPMETGVPYDWSAGAGGPMDLFGTGTDYSTAGSEGFAPTQDSGPVLDLASLYDELYAMGGE